METRGVTMTMMMTIVTESTSRTRSRIKTGMRRIEGVETRMRIETKRDKTTRIKSVGTRERIETERSKTARIKIIARTRANRIIALVPDGIADRADDIAGHSADALQAVGPGHCRKHPIFDTPSKRE
ncbi:MAG TPA: hypothetical protein GX702_11980 [Chloroflexi bacterium]|jgi:hypothetical protein|nr:hypothetical protein [Chloroflexota bacterium]